jgi:hypothetical protein
MILPRTTLDQNFQRSFCVPLVFLPSSSHKVPTHGGHICTTQDLGERLSTSPGRLVMPEGLSPRLALGP